MPLHAPRHAALLVLPLLLSACGWFGQAHTTRNLDNRLQQSLASDIASGNAALQPIPNGARVTLLSPSAFPVDEQALEDQRRDVRASVIEGLLDPSLMRIQLADTSALPAYQRDLRVRNMAQYIQVNGLGSTLQPAPVQQTEPPGAPPGLVIDVTLHCPPNRGGAGYGDGKSKPICD